MGFLPHMVAAGLYLLAVAIDMVVLLILIRLICRWRPVKVLAGLDVAAKHVVNGLTNVVDRLWARVNNSRRLSARGKLLLILALLMTARFIINILWLIMR